jgi:hypothetical protein
MLLPIGLQQVPPTRLDIYESIAKRYVYYDCGSQPPDPCTRPPTAPQKSAQ